MPARTPKSRSTPPAAPGIAHPLDGLAFLLPLLIVCEVAGRMGQPRVAAYQLTRTFIELFGPAGTLAPAAAVVIVLLATHVVSGRPWRLNLGRIGLMYLEAPLLALPLLAIGQLTAIQAVVERGPQVRDLAIALGAGVYEEFVFRLVLISLIVLLGVDVLGLARKPVAVIAVAVSAVLFAAHHHPPIGSEPFSWMAFLFRAAAGVYLSAVFWFRGYPVAAGAHAAYNVIVGLLRGA